MTLPRFLAIFAIIALGVGFFAGLKATTPSMVLTGDIYIKEHALYDFKLLSTIGFTDDDIEELKKRTGCIVEGAYSVDCVAYVGDGDKTHTIKFLSITDNVNKLSLETGRMPEKADEIVVDAYICPDMKPGTKVVIADETSATSKELLRYKEYTVVGTARTPAYLNFQRDTSNEGSGSIGFYVCALPGAFDSEYYTEAYLFADTDYYIYSDEYKDWAGSAEKQYKVALKGVIQDRFDELLREEYDKLYDGIDEFNDGIDEGWKKIEDGRAELDEAKKKLEDAQAEIDKGRKELEDGKATLDETSATLSDYKKQLTSTKVLLEASKDSLDRQKADLDSLQSDINDLYSELSEARSDLSTSRVQNKTRISTVSYLISSYKTVIADLDAGIENNTKRLEEADTEFERNVIQAQIDYQTESREYYAGLLEDAEDELERLEEKNDEFDSMQDEIDAKQKEYEGLISTYNDKYQKYLMEKVTYDTSLVSYENSKDQYDTAYKQYSDGLAQYWDAYHQLEDAQEQVDDGWEEYNKGVRELWKGYSEYSTTADTIYKANLVYGYTILESVDNPSTYVLGRDKNTGYVCFDNDSQIVEGITTVFPIFFFAIAALVCSTTMSRMVGDERGIIGTMRALGYSDFAIVMKYVIYAGSAAILGCTLGYLGGTRLFPWVIWEAYRMMYGFAPLTFNVSVPLFILVLAVSLICTVGVSVFTAVSSLKGMPAELIRPKAPLPGKRILLEYVPFIWKPLKFLYKVSLRNVFRFKKRMFMMIVGIAGCTSLLITAFGLNDSVCNLVNFQYDRITKYDVSVVFDSRYRQYEIEDAAKEAGEYAGIDYVAAVVKSDSARNSTSGYVRDVSLMISDDPNINEIFGITDYKTKEVLSWPKDGEVVISQKLAELNKVKAGDTLTLLYGDDDHEVNVTVGAVFENYTYHYVYMTPETYRQIFGKPYTPETLLISTDTDSSEENFRFASYLSDNYKLKTWALTSTSRESFSKTMERMNYIIVLVILCAAALAFIVLFNLNNINITERIREIATLKVMGFNRNETGAYVTRENIILVLIGFLVGIPLGILLHKFVMAQIAMDMVAYDVTIVPVSYAYSLGMVILFSTIVSLFMRAKIEKIDMAESLKSAE